MGAASCGASQYTSTGAASGEGQSSICVLSSLQESIPDHSAKGKLIVFIKKRKNSNECNRGYDALRVVRKGGKKGALAIHQQTHSASRDYLAVAGHGEDLEGPLFRPVRGKLWQRIDDASPLLQKRYERASSLEDDLATNVAQVATVNQSLLGLLYVSV